MAEVKLSNLTKHYGKTVGIDGIDLEIGDAEFFVILGPSGAGKTTTLKSLAGLVDVDAGSVHIGGVDMTLVEPYHRNVAMAFESYALYPQKTVAQNLASPLKSGRTGRYSPEEQQRRVDQVTETLGIHHLQQRFPRELSNGQRQRTALGRVLTRPADVYLLDEPLSHLDAKLRAEMRVELKQLGGMSHTTTVYVTHDYQEAVALGDRIAVIRQGRLVQVADPSTIWNAPADTFVAKSLGQPEINVLDGRVDDAALIVPNSNLRVPLPASLGLGAGDRARLGIRPCDVNVLPAGTEARPDHLAFAGEVVLAERLGRQIELSVDLGGTELIALSRGGELAREGARVVVEVATRNIHLFAAPSDGPSDGAEGDRDQDTARIGGADGTLQSEAAGRSTATSTSREREPIGGSVQ